MRVLLFQINGMCELEQRQTQQGAAAEKQENLKWHKKSQPCLLQVMFVYNSFAPAKYVFKENILPTNYIFSLHNEEICECVWRGAEMLVQNF